MNNMDKILKLGDKGRHIEIPDGYNLVENDNYITQRGDKVANIITAKWESIVGDEVGMKAFVVGDFVIKPDK